MTQAMTIGDFLEHHGVKGMKWGVRKERDNAPSARRQRYDEILNAKSMKIDVVARNGKTVTVSEDPNGKVTAFLASLSKKGVARNAEARRDYPSFKSHVDGKHVGNASFHRGGRDGNDPDEINLSWIGVKKSERGNGYASSVFDAAVQYGRETGAKKLTLEVPGKSPDARHIYEKQGFKVTWEPTPAQAKQDRTWGGLTDMELDLTKDRLRHAAMDDDDGLELALIQTFPQLTEAQEALVFPSTEEAAVAHAMEIETFLAHCGINKQRT